MARRTLKRRRVSRRRSNPRRSTGMLVINPRRRKRRAAPKKRKANPRHKRTATARRPARRRPVRRRVAGAKRRAYGLRRRPAAPRTKIVYRKANPKRKRKTRRRSNPGMLGGLKKFPILGPVLAAIPSFLPSSLFGALSVEPTMWIAKLLGGFMPMVPASLGYAAYGLLLGSLIHAFGSKIGLSPKMKGQLATAATAAAGGVAYYKWRMGADMSMAEEVGLLELHGVGGLGSLLLDPGSMSGVGYGDMAYSVMPYPGVA